jgi:hypothetical protein
MACDFIFWQILTLRVKKQIDTNWKFSFVKCKFPKNAQNMKKIYQSFEATMFFKKPTKFSLLNGLGQELNKAIW